MKNCWRRRFLCDPCRIKERRRLVLPRTFYFKCNICSELLILSQPVLITDTANVKWRWSSLLGSHSSRGIIDSVIHSIPIYLLR
jgi:hypothetical protein